MDSGIPFSYGMSSHSVIVPLARYTGFELLPTVELEDVSVPELMYIGLVDEPTVDVLAFAVPLFRYIGFVELPTVDVPNLLAVVAVMLLHCVSVPELM